VARPANVSAAASNRIARFCRNVCMRSPSNNLPIETGECEQAQSAYENRYLPQ
jgi:hypothetical protein